MKVWKPESACLERDSIAFLESKFCERWAMLIEIRADWEPKFRVEMTCLLPADNCKTVFKKSLQREGLLRDKERNPSLQVVGTRSGAIRARTSNGDEKGKHP